MLVQGEGQPAEINADGRQDLDAYLGAIASANKLDVAAAERLVTGQDAFSAAIAEIQQTDPDTYSASSLEITDAYDAWILFTDRPSAAALAVLKQLPINTEVRVGAPHSEVELTAALESSFRTVYDHDDTTSASGWYDAASGTVYVEYWLADGARPSAVEAAARASENPRDIEVVVRESSGPEPQSEVIGGQHLSNGCTSAFVVSSGSLRGVLSAWHCLNAASGYTFGGEYNGAAGDVQWHRTTDNVTNQFRFDEFGSVRAVTSKYSPAAGASACKYGAANGYGCTTVYLLNTCGADGTCGLTSTTAYITAPGDSGGPWFWQNTAFGVHKGVAFVNFANRSQFTPITAAQSVLGVSVCITPCGLVLIAASLSAGSLVLLAGCSSAPSTNEAGDLLLVASSSYSGDQALVSGTLEVVNGCVHVETSDGILYAIVFPPGSAFDEDGRIVAGGQRFELGQGLEAAGGFYPSEGLPMRVAIPDACLTEEVAAVWF